MSNVSTASNGILNNTILNNTAFTYSDTSLSRNCLTNDSLSKNNAVQYTLYRITLLFLTLCLIFLSPFTFANENPITTPLQIPYANQEFKVLDASQLQLDGASAIVVTFSIPVAIKPQYSSYLNLIDQESGQVDGAWERSHDGLELRFRYLKPERKFTLHINQNLTAVNGKSLTAAFTDDQLETPRITPTIGFASRGFLLPSKVISGLPVIALNTDKVDVNFYRIKSEKIASFIASWKGTGAKSYWQLEEYLDDSDLIYTGRFDLQPAPNTREQLLLPLSNIKALAQPGVYLAIMNQAGQYNYSQPTTLFTLSDIGLSLHRSQDRLDFFAQALETGASLADVKIELLDEKGVVLATTTTTADGHAQLTSHDEAQIVLATSGQSTTIIELNRAALDLSEFTITGPTSFSSQLFTFGPRDIYRPGEIVLVNALLRHQDGTLLEPQPIKVEVLKPDGQVLATELLEPKSQGLYQYQYDLSQNANTGNWSLRFNLGDGYPPRFYQFKVEDFLPERMELAIHSNSDSPIPTNENVRFNFTGRYLYDAPTSGNALEARLFLRQVREAVPTLPGYQFGSILEDNSNQTLDFFEQKLDKNGLAKLDIESQWNESRSPLKVIAQASLLESGGRPVTRQAEQLIWPAQTMPGIRPLFSKKESYDYRTDRYSSNYTVDSESIADFDLIYTNFNGDKLAADELNVRLIRERRDYYWTWSSREGWASNYDQKDLTIDQKSISIKNGEVLKVSYPVVWGSYRLEVEDPKTGVVTNVRFFAGYDWQDNTNGSGALRPDQVKLTLDKPAYNIGEKAMVHVEAPTSGKGYLMLEASNGPLWWQEIDLPVGGASIEVPINKEWHRSDLYLSALVIRPGDKTKHATPKRAIGLLHLPINNEQRKIALTLTTPTRIYPNNTLAVKVKASVKQGKLPQSVNVLLSAVDSGVLNITDFVTPDPYDGFFGRKRYNVDQLDVYGQLIEGQGKIAKLSFGGDSDEPLSQGGKKPKSLINIVALQAIPIKLDDNGEGEILLPLPNFNGELRLMAQAWSDEMFGHTEQKIVVAADIIAELSMPRFMASGDSSTLALDVINQTKTEQSLQLKMSTKGLAQFTTDTNQKLTLAQGERKTLFFTLKALDGFGQADIDLNISGIKADNIDKSTSSNAIADTLQHHWTLGVRPATTAVTKSYPASLAPGETFTLQSKVLDGLIYPTVEGELSLTASPPLNISQHIRELLAYPYGCLEQTTSGIFPLLYSNQEQLAKLGIKGESDQTRRKKIQVGIERLEGMQNDNGGFSLWRAGQEEEYWLTAYVTDFLVQAQKQGYTVQKNTLVKANQRLLRYIQNGSVIDIPYYGRNDATIFGVQAYAGLVLARQQQAPLGTLRQLFQGQKAKFEDKNATMESPKSPSALSLVQLGVALQLMGDKPKAEEIINIGISAKIMDQQRRHLVGNYGSQIRDYALIVALLQEFDLQPEQKSRLLLNLSEQLRAKSYLSTQERNAVYLAGYQQQAQPSPQWQVTVSNTDNNTIKGTQLETRHYDVAQLVKGITITNIGTTTVYSNIDIIGYPTKQPQPQANTLSISRDFLNLDGTTATLDNLTSGQLLIVVLSVKSSVDLNDALIVDLLPAGFELENQNLTGKSADLTQLSSDLNKPIDFIAASDIKYQEYRDDRYVAALKHLNAGDRKSLLYLVRAVTPGHYSVPAPFAESMYNPQWHAIGATPKSIEIKNR